MDSAVDWLRGVNAACGVAVLLLLLPRLAMVWGRFSRGQRAIFTALLFYVVANIFGSIELILLDDNRFTTRAVLVLFGHTAALIYLLEPRRRYTARLGEDPLDPHMPNRRGT